MYEDCMICKEKMNNDKYNEIILTCDNNHSFHKECVLSNQFKVECSI